jgi:hypothetical protein
MKKTIISGLFLMVALVGVFTTPSASAQVVPTSQTAMLAQIEQLMKLIAQLQKQLDVAKGDIQELMSDLSEGAQGDDVKKAQEVLATDPTIFGVKPTGYFGPVTREALMKFQERYGLEVTGKLDEATREAIKELRKDGKITPGLLVSEAAKARVRARLEEKWGDCDFTRPVKERICEKVKEKKNDDTDMDDEDDEENESDDMDDDSDDDKTVTRDDARRAVVDAQNEINRFRATLEDMRDDDTDEDAIGDAVEALREAQKEMSKARRALATQDFKKAYESADEVSDILNDDSGDDVDEDDRDDEDEDDDDDA